MMKSITLLFLILAFAITTLALPNNLPEKNNKKDWSKSTEKNHKDGFRAPIKNNPWWPEPPKSEPHWEPQPPHWTAPFPQPTLSWGNKPSTTSSHSLPTQSVSHQPWKRNANPAPYQPGHMSSVTHTAWRPTQTWTTSTATATSTSTAAPWNPWNPIDPGKGHGWPEPNPGHGWEDPKPEPVHGWNENKKQQEEEYNGRAKHDSKKPKVLEA